MELKRNLSSTGTKIIPAWALLILVPVLELELEIILQFSSIKNFRLYQLVQFPLLRLNWYLIALPCFTDTQLEVSTNYTLLSNCRSLTFEHNPPGLWDRSHKAVNKTSGLGLQCHYWFRIWFVVSANHKQNYQDLQLLKLNRLEAVGNSGNGNWKWKRKWWKLDANEC